MQSSLASPRADGGRPVAGARRAPLCRSVSAFLTYGTRDRWGCTSRLHSRRGARWPGAAGGKAACVTQRPLQKLARAHGQARRHRPWVLQFTERNTIWGHKGDPRVSPGVTGSPLFSLREMVPLQNNAQLPFLSEAQTWQECPWGLGAG